jgi:hypothetical protein
VQVSLKDLLNKVRNHTKFAIVVTNVYFIAPFHDLLKDNIFDIVNLLKDNDEDVSFQAANIIGLLAEHGIVFMCYLFMTAIEVDF